MTEFAWRRHGLIFRPDGRVGWMKSHATTPTARHLEGDVYRVYFGSRDERNRSHVGFADVELGDRPVVVRVSERPSLAPGPWGYFDDHGVYGTTVVEHDGALWMYY